MIYYVDAIDATKQELYAKGPKKAYQSMFKLEYIPFDLKCGDFFEYTNNTFIQNASQTSTKLFS